MADPERAYWDACAWLGLINGEPAKIRSLEYVYERARRGQIEIWTSTIAYVEVFRHQSEQHMPTPLLDEGNLDLIKDAIEQPFIKLIPLDMEIGRLARKLRRMLENFKGAADAVHLASALTWDVSPLHTWDGSHLLPWHNKLDCKNGTKLQIFVPPEPSPDGPLFGGKSDQST